MILSQIFTDTNNKIALSTNVDNRIVQDDKTTTGNYSMQERQVTEKLSTHACVKDPGINFEFHRGSAAKFKMCQNPPFVTNAQLKMFV